MAKKVTVTRTEENVTDEMGLEGWLLELGTDPEIQAVHVWKQNPRGGWTRLPAADLAPPFDGAPTAVYERYGDGMYRFVGIGPRMKFRGGSKDVGILGYGEGAGGAGRPAGAGPGATPAGIGALEAMRETVDQMRLEVQMASLQRMLDRMNPPAAGGEGPLSREERAVLHQEALDRDLDRVAKLKALMGGEGRPQGDPLETVGKVLDLVGSKLAGLGRGTGTGMLKETLELLTVARELLGSGGGEEGWGGLLRDVIRNPSPELLRTIREAILTARGVPPPPRPAPRAVAPAPGAPLRYPPTAPPGPAPAAAPAAAAGNSNPTLELPPDHPWEVLRLKIIPALLEAAARGDRGFLRYAELIDELLPPAQGRPGALEEFTQFEFPVSLERLAHLEPRLREPQAAAWLQEFYTWVRDEYFLPEEVPGETTQETPPPAAGPEETAPAR